MIAACVGVYADTGGSLLDVETKVGLGGSPIRLLTFRTSARKAFDASGRGQPTRFGAILRKTGVDALPLLFNVLRGDLSLVGPEPDSPELAAILTVTVCDYTLRQGLRPGLTGAAQVRGLSADSRGTAILKERAECDNLYVKTWSVAGDVKILMQTLRNVLLQGEP